MFTCLLKKLADALLEWVTIDWMVSGEGRKLYADDGEGFSCLSSCEDPAVVFLTRGRDMMGGLSGQSSSREWSSLAVAAVLPTGLNT